MSDDESITDVKKDVGMYRYKNLTKKEKNARERDINTMIERIGGYTPEKVAMIVGEYEKLVEAVDDLHSALGLIRNGECSRGWAEHCDFTIYQDDPMEHTVHISCEIDSGCSCCPDECYGDTLPLKFIYDPAFLLQYKNDMDTERNRVAKEEAKAKKRQESKAIRDKAKREKEEYERLKKKFGENKDG